MASMGIVVPIPTLYYAKEVRMGGAHLQVGLRNRNRNRNRISLPRNAVKPMDLSGAPACSQGESANYLENDAVNIAQKLVESSPSSEICEDETTFNRESVSVSSLLQQLVDSDTHFSLLLFNGDYRVPTFLLLGLEFLGSAVFWLPGCVLGSVLIWAFGTSGLVSWAFFMELFLVLLLDAVMVGILKGSIRRPRPLYNSKNGSHFFDNWSFPSGHSSRTFFIASFFLLKSGALLTKVLAPPYYYSFAALALLWALSTALSRVLLGRHYLLDVLAGSCLGILEAFILNSLPLCTIA